MEKVNYGHLISVSGRSPQQVKRYALAFCGVDPNASGGRGITREYEINDGFYIYLIGVLVADYGMQLGEAQSHIYRIIPELDTRGLLPSIRWDRRDPVPRIVLRIHPGHVYEYRTYIKRTPDETENWDTGDQNVDDPYVARWVPKGKIGDAAPGPVFEVPLTAYLGHYILTLRGQV
jgi:hypothetical protein